MIQKAIKMPSVMQGCHTLKKLFKMKAYSSVKNPTHIRMTECYIYCNEKDEKIVRQLVQEFKERYYEKVNGL